MWGFLETEAVAAGGGRGIPQRGWGFGASAADKGLQLCYHSFDGYRVKNIKK